MRKLLSVFLIFFIFLFVFAGSSQAANYGSGTYGNGLYGQGSAPTSSPGSSGLSSGGGGSSNPAPSGCSDASPTTSPNLFQIDTKNTQARVYFAPAGSNVSSYYISFGLGALDEGFGAPLNINPQGAGFYDVTYLNPNTVYTFKIRGSNGCASGPWSNSVTARTTGSAKSTVKYYPNKQASAPIYSTIAGLPGYIKTKVTSPSTKVASQPQSKSQTASSPQKSPPTASAPKAVPKPQSLFDKIKSFFGF